MSRKEELLQEKLEDCKTNIKETLKILNNIIGKRKSEIKHSNEFCVGENQVVLESKEIGNHFNKFFVDIGTNLSNLIEPCLGTKPTDFIKSNIPQLMYIHPVAVQEVLDTVSGCKSKTSHGHDEISMKTVIKQIVKPLTHIFNSSLICRSFPNVMNWQKSFLYLSEVIVFNFLIIDLYLFYPNFFKYLKILSDGQYGFRSNHSTSLAPTEFVEKVTSAMDKSLSTIGVFISI